VSPAVILNGRTRAIRLVVASVFLVMVLRLVQVQEFGHQHYAALSRAQLTQEVTVPPVRGGIYDRNGEVLAETVTRQTVVADPEIIKDPTSLAATLSPILGIPASTLRSELTEPSGFVYLAHRVPDSVVTTLDRLDLNGINLVPEAQRVVPVGLLAEPVVGTVGWNGGGASGIEYQYDSLLAGRPGSTDLLESPDGVSLPNSDRSTPAQPGTGLELTLDESVQYVTEHALATEIVASHATSGTAVIMDVKTGDILAMANLDAAPGTAGAASGTATGAATPTLTAQVSSPTNTSGPTLVAPSDTLPAGVVEAPSNSAVTQVYEPGSVFKLVTFSAALADGLVTPNSPLAVPPELQLGRYTFHDAETHGTEMLTATQILAQSSNLGTIEVAEKLGESRLQNQISLLGFGSPTGLGVPGESEGLVPGPAQWTDSSIGSTPIGQDDAVTAQQVLDAYNAVANGGVFVSPRLVRATVAPDGKSTAVAPSESHEIIDPTVNAELVNMLEAVVTEGTGTEAAIDGYTVAGKTGTAQIPSADHLGYVPGAYVGSFAGFAPAQDPVLSAIVVLNHPTPIYGGAVAAPVFSTIMSYALHHFGIPTTTTATTADSSTAVGGAGSITVPAGAVTEGP
jgi:cell division protein FtsI (penicillin-binding protein 3)